MTDIPGSSEIDIAAQRLVGAVRAVMLAAAVSDIDLPTMGRAHRLIAEANDLLRGSVLSTGRRNTMNRTAIAKVRSGAPWQVFSHNPLGIPLSITVHDTTASAQLQPSALFEGPPGLLHGGFSAAMLDALLSTLVQAQDIKAVTVRLDVQFHLAVPVNEPITLYGAITDISGRKVSAEGSLTTGETLAVTGRALFITLAGEPD